MIPFIPFGLSLTCGGTVSLCAFTVLFWLRRPYLTHAMANTFEVVYVGSDVALLGVWLDSYKGSSVPDLMHHILVAVFGCGVVLSLVMIAGRVLWARWNYHTCSRCREHIARRSTTPICQVCCKVYCSRCHNAIRESERKCCSFTFETINTTQLEYHFVPVKNVWCPRALLHFSHEDRMRWQVLYYALHSIPMCGVCVLYCVYETSVISPYTYVKCALLTFEVVQLGPLLTRVSRNQRMLHLVAAPAMAAAASHITGTTPPPPGNRAEEQISSTKETPVPGPTDHTRTSDTAKEETPERSPEASRLEFQTPKIKSPESAQLSSSAAPIMRVTTEKERPVFSPGSGSSESVIDYLEQIRLGIEIEMLRSLQKGETPQNVRKHLDNLEALPLADLWTAVSPPGELAKISINDKAT